MPVTEYEECERRASSGKEPRILSKQERSKLVRGSSGGNGASVFRLLLVKRELKRIQKSREESSRQWVELECLGLSSADF